MPYGTIVGLHGGDTPQPTNTDEAIAAARQDIGKMADAPVVAITTSNLRFSSALNTQQEVRVAVDVLDIWQDIS
jgi:hypothetical protein